MATTAEIVRAYLDAYYKGRREQARQYLDENVVLSGPVASFTGADAVAGTAEHVSNTVKELKIQRLLSDEHDVSTLLEVVTDHPSSPLRIAEWYQLEAGKITAIRLVFDTAPYVHAPAGEHEAIDPVCKMSVDKAHAPDTRTHAGETYYFCSPLCGDAFAAAPQTYLRA